MSFWDIAQMAQDIDLGARIVACVATEGIRPPTGWATQDKMLLVCAAPGWDAAWESAEASGNENPGRDPAVITDQQILASVQQVVRDEQRRDEEEAAR